MSWLCITQVKKTPKQRAEEESLWGLLAAKFIHTFLPWLISAVLFVLYKNIKVCDKGIDNLISEYAVDRRNFLNDLKRNSISEYLFRLWKGRESWKGIGQVCACVCVSDGTRRIQISRYSRKIILRLKWYFRCYIFYRRKDMVVDDKKLRRGWDISYDEWSVVDRKRITFF